MSKPRSLLTLVLMAGAGSCCPHADPACAKWAKKGETFELEILAHAPGLPEVPDGGFSSWPSDASCPELFAFEPGQTTSFRVRGKPPDYTPEEGCGCYPMLATFAGPEVAIVGPGRPDEQQPAVVEANEIETANGCRGYLTWEVSGIWGYDAGAPTDFTLRRIFIPRTRVDCQDFGHPDGVSTCHDTWFVRIRDDAGNEIRAPQEE
jgi:hypothetical protein